MAYNSGDGTRDSSKDIDLAPGITYSVGLWSDGTTMWSVKAGFDDKVFAYELSSGNYQSENDFNTLDAADNYAPRGMWSDGTTMWILDAIRFRVFAYDLASKQRTPDKDFDSLVRDNLNASGIWSDGTTLWVADQIDAKI